MAFSLFLFIHSVLLSLIRTYIPGVCNFLHLVLLAVSFVVINLLFSQLLVSSICKCVICSNRKEKVQNAVTLLDVSLKRISESLADLNNAVKISKMPFFKALFLTLLKPIQNQSPPKLTIRWNTMLHVQTYQEFFNGLFYSFYEVRQAKNGQIRFCSPSLGNLGLVEVVLFSKNFIFSG